MSQYGKIQSNYYTPKLKFNTLRLIYLYDNFYTFQGLINGFCLFNLLRPIITGSLVTTNVEGNCQSETPVKINSGNFTLNTPTINSCELDYIDQTTIPTYISNYIKANITGACSANSSNAVTPATSPTGYTSGLFQETVSNWCRVNTQYLSPSGSLTTIEVTGSCPSEIPAKINAGNFTLNTHTINSCELDYIDQTEIATRVELNSRVILISGACSSI